MLADNYPSVPDVLHTVETRMGVTFGRDQEEQYHKPIYKAEVILKLDRLTIKCLPFKEHVLRVADRYQKARAHSIRGVSCKQPSKRKPKFSWRVVKEFLGEPYGLENAINYMQLHDQPVYFWKNRKGEPELIVDYVKVEGDFIQQKGHVTHAPSGIGCAHYKTIDSLDQRIYDAVNELSEDDLKFLERARTEHGCA